MRQIIIMLFIYAGLLFSCQSNKKSAKVFGKKGSSAAHKPQPKATDNVSPVITEVSKEAGNVNSEEPKTQTRVDSLLEAENPSAYRRSGTNFQGASGAGTGGSYASTYYANQNKKKKPNNTVTQAYKHNLQTDSLSLKRDSLDYSNNSW